MSFDNGCECTIPTGGFCERHGVEKTPGLVNRCKTNLKYWLAWEEGRGPRQKQSKVVEKREKKNCRESDVTEQYSEEDQFFAIELCKKCPVFDDLLTFCKASNCSHLFRPVETRVADPRSFCPLNHW